MKKLSEISVNAAKLKLIIGENINFPFPTKIVLTKVGKETLKTLPETLANVIKGSDYANKRSFDPRFDGKHPVIIATANIREVGLSKSIVAGIRNDYKCLKLKKITGKYAVLADLITNEHNEEIIDILTKSHEAKLQVNPKYFNRK